MRVIITAFWSGVSLFILVYPASAKMDYTIGGELDSPQYTHLIDTNQSQTFEPMSTSLKNFPHLASVRFITGKSKMEFGDMEFSDETITYCAKSGYQKRVSAGSDLQSGARGADGAARRTKAIICILWPTAKAVTALPRA